MRALLRRAAKPAAEDKLFTAGSLAVDVKRRAVTVDGEPVILTYKEFELLCYLLENRGVVLSRDQILTKIWDYNYSGETPHGRRAYPHAAAKARRCRCAH